MKLGSCQISAKGVGIKGCLSGNPVMMPYKVLLGVPGFSFDTYDDFKDEDVINQAISDQKIFPLESFVDIEGNTKENTTYEGGLGDEFITRYGKRGFTGYMNMTLKQNQLLQGYSNVGWTIFIVDDAGNLEGYTPDGIVVAGYSASTVEILPMMRTFSTDNISKSGIKIMLEYNKQMDESIVVALADELDFLAKEIEPLTLVTITNAKFDTDELTASFNVVNDRSANNTSTPINTVEVANISVLDQAGAAVVPSTSTETSTQGSYVFAAAANLMTDGTIELIPDKDNLFYSEATPMTAV